MLRIKSFIDNEGFHFCTGCRLDHELKENVFTFQVTTKHRSGKLIRTYKVLSSQILPYYNELLNRDDTINIYVF